MLHHEDRVAFVPQALQKFGHAVDIPRMHSGAWLVKNVDHACKRTSHIAHQLQTLCLTAGERCGFPVHAQIGKSDLNHACQGSSQGIDNGFASGVFDLLQDGAESGKFHITHFINAVPVYAAGKRCGIQALSTADRAFPFFYQPLQAEEGAVTGV